MYIHKFLFTMLMWTNFKWNRVVYILPCGYFHYRSKCHDNLFVFEQNKKLRKNGRSISILNPSKVSFFSENGLNAFAWLKLWTSHHTYDQPLVMTSKLYNTISRLQNFLSFILFSRTIFTSPFFDVFGI